MSSWSCPHFDEAADHCRRVKAACVPGRKGCILPKNLVFATPPQLRVQQREAQAPPTPPEPSR